MVGITVEVYKTDKGFYNVKGSLLYNGDSIADWWAPEGHKMTKGLAERAKINLEAYFDKHGKMPNLCADPILW